MNLYEISAAIESCIYEAADPETGEIIEEALDLDALEALEMERDEKIKNVALWIKNLQAEASALKAEKLKLADRQKKAENRAESLKRYIDGALAGEKWSADDGVVKISYRHSKALQLADGYTEEAAVQALMDSGNTEYLKQAAPTLKKTELKNAIIKDGLVFDGLEVVETSSLQIK